MLIFRPAVLADVPTVHRLVESAYRGESAKLGWTHEADLLGGQRTDADMLSSMIASSAQTLILAEQASSIIGCVMVEDRTDYGYVGLVTVDPVLQANRLGRQLLDAAERYIMGPLRLSRARMTVIVQRTELIAWYQRRGYIDTGEQSAFPYGDPRFGEPVRDDLSFVVLEKRLV